MPPAPQEGEAGLHIRGRRNLALLGAVLGVVLLQGVWQPGPSTCWARAVGLERLLAVAAFLAITLVSFRVTPIAPAGGERLRLGGDGRGRQAVRRHLHLHGAAAGDPAGRARRARRPGWSR